VDERAKACHRVAWHEDRHHSEHAAEQGISCRLGAGVSLQPLFDLQASFLKHIFLEVSLVEPLAFGAGELPATSVAPNSMLSLKYLYFSSPPLNALLGLLGCMCVSVCNL
jgi:hypothetical protein